MLDRLKVLGRMLLGGLAHSWDPIDGFLPTNLDAWEKGDLPSRSPSEAMVVDEEVLQEKPSRRMAA